MLAHPLSIFEQNRTIEAGVHVTFHTLQDPIFYARTKLGQDILIGGGDIPPTRNSIKTPLAAEFYFRLQLDASRPV